MAKRSLLSEHPRIKFVGFFNDSKNYNTKMHVITHVCVWRNTSRCAKIVLIKYNSGTSGTVEPHQKRQHGG